MAERSFAKEVRTLGLGDGDVFHGEGILAVAKALLQSGVSYVGGYQGAPVSHMMDVFSDAREILDSLGVHVETCANEAAACAMLAASINYPVRGCAVWKSTVGTNVASDALSNLASAGVTGGALIVVGEDYGDGASIIQERSHAFAMKSQVWLLDPRPSLPAMVRAVEKGFELSEASNTPVMLELRIRACHVHGSFTAKANRPPAYSSRRFLDGPRFDYERICLPPSTYLQEQKKVRERWPAAVEFLREHRLNEHFPACGPDAIEDVGIITQGGMYNAVLRALALLGFADPAGNARVPIFVLNATYPLVPEEISGFCAGKRAVLVVEEGQPDYLEEAIGSLLRRADVNTKLLGKGPFPMAGEYTGEVVLRGIDSFLRDSLGHNEAPDPGVVAAVDDAKRRAAEILAAPVPGRPPGFCTGCPERPVFSALKIVQREVGEMHVSADIGCHTFATLPPFHIGNTVLGYGLGLASSAAITPHMGKRTVSIMGDGGFWHNGLTTGVASSVFNRSDDVLVVMNNGYTSATGGQAIPSTRVGSGANGSGSANGGAGANGRRFEESGPGASESIERALRGVRGEVGPARADLFRREDGQGPARRPDRRRQGAQGHRGGRRMPAHAPAPLPAVVRPALEGGPAGGAYPFRGGRGRVHGGSLLHPPLRLSELDREGELGPASHRPGRARRQRLRGVRSVRRGRARGGALPVVLPRRDREQPVGLGPASPRRAKPGHRGARPCLKPKLKPPWPPGRVGIRIRTSPPIRAPARHPEPGTGRRGARRVRRGVGRAFPDPRTAALRTALGAASRTSGAENRRRTRRNAPGRCSSRRWAARAAACSRAGSWTPLRRMGGSSRRRRCPGSHNGPGPPPTTWRSDRGADMTGRRRALLPPLPPPMPPPLRPPVRRPRMAPARIPPGAGSWPSFPPPATWTSSSRPSSSKPGGPPRTG